MAEQQDHDTYPAITPAVGVEDASAPATAEASAPSDGTVSGARQALLDNVQKGREQATEKARLFAEDGKTRATSALGQLSEMLNDAAGQGDEKLGEQYGAYAQQAAEKVQGLSSAIDSKTVDDLVDDVRELVKKSPAIAVGVAAGIGFVLARLVTAGIDQRDA